MSGRMILVSNRLPVSVRRARGKLDVTASSGGLASGLRSVHGNTDTLWIGWPGLSEGLDAETKKELDERLAALRTAAVHLTPNEVNRFYEGYSNGVLWPLLHYLVDRIPLECRDWTEYKRVNERFADVVCEHATEEDRIWVHDYHLMLLPAMIRKRLPGARIGFFLHVPFPSSEVFRIAPHDDQLLVGLLGADLIGFHTFSYARHFTSVLLRVLGIEAEVDRLSYEGRQVRIGTFPMGIDGAAFATLSEREDVIAELENIRRGAGDAKILIGVDRLDYTKGLLQRLHAIERLLERQPKARGRIRMVQLSVPSREHVPEYKSFRRQLEELVGRINGSYGTLNELPIHYLYRSVSPVQLTAMYRSAAAMLVTPLRDGMNLVAKEFVAARTDGDGVLVLSEFAGAASELGEAMMVNPYDVEGLADTFARALDMPEEERRRRMAALRARVMSRTIDDWAASFVSALDATADAHRPIDARNREQLIGQIAAHLAKAEELVLLLDYDGTLVPIRQRPELAAPDVGLLELLRDLAALSGVRVHIVTGRTRESITRFVGELPLALHAEHGLWYRPTPDAAWTQAVEATADWKASVRPVFDEYAARTPGAVVEEKSAGLAWHYRAADPQLGPIQAKELRMHLVGTLAQQPVKVVTGHKVVEVRASLASKALAYRAAVEASKGNVLIAAFGDDQTDEDMLTSLPEGSYSFAVGNMISRATHRLSSPDEVRALLRRVIALRKKD